MLQPCIYTGIDVRWCSCKHCARRRGDPPKSAMPTVALVAALALAGCGGVQRVAECTLAEAQPAMKPLADAIWKDAITGRYAPTEVLKQDVRDLVLQYGQRLVVCSLEELIRKWKEESRRSAAHNAALGLAEQLRDGL